MEPNSEQLQKLYQFAGARRFVYNRSLARRKEHYNLTGKILSYNNLAAELTQLKKQEETAWLKEADSQSLQQGIKDLDKAYQNFFTKRARFPRFRSRNKGHFSFRIPQRVKVDNGKIYCPKIGWIKIRQSREVDGTLKSATFKRDACGDWYVSLVVEFEMPEVTLPEPKKPIGVDMGLTDIVYLSNGESTSAPRFFRRFERKLTKMQRRLSRAKKGSSRRQRAKLRVAKVHRKIARCRSDFTHKLTFGLVNRFDHIGIEDLSVKGMAKTKLAKSVHDAVLGEIERQLEYKSLWNHVRLVKISRWFPSSKMCGGCGTINKELKLSDRQWFCGCGVKHHRDLNAARNILQESLNVAVGHADTQNARGATVRLAMASASR